jgi:glycosyltransferase involved in cell wall biosynthesis
MKTILASVYAVNPYKGSEDGMGWNFICQISRYNKVIAITRKNNRAHIEKYLHEHPKEYHKNISFLYFDLPYWMRIWKKGSRGAMVYFYLWQRSLPAFIKKQSITYDIVHNINFHNDWTPSFLWKLHKPFVWGPIGHHPRIPRSYLKRFAAHYYLKDRFTWLIKKYFWNYSLSLQKTKKHADHILCMNTSVPRLLNLEGNSFSIVPSVATEDFGYTKSKNDSFTLITAGRLVPLKGFDLSILSFASFFTTLSEADKAHCKLIIVGSGPEKKRLQDLARAKGVANHTVFIDWLERPALLKRYEDASVFIFPSHEGAGMVVAEALSFALPVICLDNEGPGEFITNDCGIAVPTGDYKQTITLLSNAIGMLYRDRKKREQMSLKARERFETHFSWEQRGDQLNEIYQKLTI